MCKYKCIALQCVPACDWLVATLSLLPCLLSPGTACTGQRELPALPHTGPRTPQRSIDGAQPKSPSEGAHPPLTGRRLDERDAYRQTHVCVYRQTYRPASSIEVKLSIEVSRAGGWSGRAWVP